MGRYLRNTYDYDMNLELFHYIEDHVPMVRTERELLRNWIRKGHDFYSNPWGQTDISGHQLNYIEAYRREFGYPGEQWISRQDFRFEMII